MLYRVKKGNNVNFFELWKYCGQCWMSRSWTNKVAFAPPSPTSAPRLHLQTMIHHDLIISFGDGGCVVDCCG